MCRRRWMLARAPLRIYSWLQVEEDLKIVREAWGLVPDDLAEVDAAVGADIKQLFEPIKNQTWPTGRQNNRT